MMDASVFDERVRAAREASWKNFGRRIRFYVPSFMPYRAEQVKRGFAAFPSISITGNDCALKCKHCQGRLLRTMIAARSADDLLRTFEELHREEAVGCLVSGGCGLDGAVPLEPFVDVIAEAKGKFGLKIVIHTGIVSDDVAEKLGKARVDAVMIDVIGSDETIQEVYGLDRKVEDYDASLRVLEKQGVPVVPHILVGLHYGRLKGELEALKMVARHRPSAVIVIGLTPLRGTPMELCSPASPRDVVFVITEARRLMPQTPVALGCARPKGRLRREMDVLAVQAGVNAIAYPDPKAVEVAQGLSLDYDYSGLCCSQICEDLAVRWKAEK